MREKSLFTRLLVHSFPALMAALAATAWDLVIDPIAVSGGWWVWVGGGQYFPSIGGGIPASNFIGWIALSFAIQLFYRMVLLPHETHSTIIDGSNVLYLALFLSSIGVAITELQRGDVAAVGFICMGMFIFPVLTHREFLTSLRAPHK
jgi:uncharacterized membrane protein